MNNQKKKIQKSILSRDKSLMEKIILYLIFDLHKHSCVNNSLV